MRSETQTNRKVGHIIDVCFTFQETAKLFFKVVVPLYTAEFGSWKSKLSLTGLNLRLLAGLVSFRGEPISLYFSVSSGNLYSLDCGPCLHLKGHHSTLCFSHHIPFSCLWKSCLCLSLVSTLWLQPGPTQITSDNLPSSRALI